MEIKSTLLALLVSSQATTAKSFLPCNNSIETIANRACATSKRPSLVQPSSVFVKEIKPATSTRVHNDILALRAGAIWTLPTLTSLNIFLKQYPYVAAFIICGLQASAADWIAQKSTQMNTKDSVVDVRGGTSDARLTRIPFQFKRNLAFLFYGGIYQGCFQEHLFNKIFPMIFGEGKAPLTIALKVTFDMLVVSPFLCLPVAYLIKGAIYNTSLQKSVRRYIHDVRQNALLKTYWSVWYPVQIFNFMLVPKQFRISFIACFSFFWLIMLSAISGKAEKSIQLQEC